MRTGYRLHAIRYQLTARKRILHALMGHRDPVADCYRVELHRYAAGLYHALLQEFADFVEVAVPGNETLVGIAYADEGLLHV